MLDFVTSYVREFVFDADTLDDGLRKIFYNYDVKKFPLYDNQEGYWSDLELVESIWKIKPDIESPENFSEPPTPTMIHDAIACTADNKPENKPDDVPSSGSPATPPVGKRCTTEATTICLLEHEISW